MVHLVFGPSGAGKTTHAQKIAQEKQAIHFSIDECVKPLSFPDHPDMNYLMMVFDKMKDCGAKIIKKSEQLIIQNREVVLDLATFRREHRDFIRNWATNINSPVTLYYVSASLLTRRGRVLKRNVEKGATYSFDLPEWVFNLAENQFEPPAEDENAIWINND